MKNYNRRLPISLSRMSWYQGKKRTRQTLTTNSNIAGLKLRREGTNKNIHLIINHLLVSFLSLRQPQNIVWSGHYSDPNDKQKRSKSRSIHSTKFCTKRLDLVWGTTMCEYGSQWQTQLKCWDWSKQSVILHMVEGRKIVSFLGWQSVLVDGTIKFNPLNCILANTNFLLPLVKRGWRHPCNIFVIVFWENKLRNIFSRYADHILKVGPPLMAVI